MSRHAPACGRCGAVLAEAGAVVTLASTGDGPLGEATLCRACTDQVVELLGPTAFLPVEARKAVVDPRMYQTR
ncbi:hypothetical protein [Paludisphaera rhizosphaerae]|uniref:hypothetical protein n=1 Tax=Paludisphaera rhizosphaerae TaxID=2711216 RepID=UPI0013EAC9E5|nr:hypothetical protein [Paludisphaera rhizosphaerae]